MSAWTNVTGVIRYNCAGGRFGEESLPDLGKTFLPDWDTLDWDEMQRNPENSAEVRRLEQWRRECTVPCGSENSIRYEIWKNPNENDMASMTVTIWGDLRDYIDKEEIVNYFNRIVKGKFVRSGLFEVAGPDFFSVYVYDDNREEFVEVHRA